MKSIKNLIGRLRKMGADNVGSYGMPIAGEAATELERLQKIEVAARNLIDVRGRCPTAEAYNQLESLLKGETK